VVQNGLVRNIISSEGKTHPGPHIVLGYLDMSAAGTAVKLAGLQVIIS